MFDIYIYIYDNSKSVSELISYIDGILPKGLYLPCLYMADRALLAEYPRYGVDIHWGNPLYAIENQNHNSLENVTHRCVKTLYVSIKY